MTFHRNRRALLAAVFTTAVFLGGAAAEAATPDNALVVAQSIDDAVSFDPAEGFELTTVQTFNNVYQRLVESDRTDGTRIAPAIASEWTLGEDGKSLTFAIRQGATFASGNPIRPEDVIFSFSRAVKLNKSPAFILNELGWTAATVDAGLKKVDDRHVQLTWTADVGPAFALALLTAPIASIIDEKTVAEHVSGEDFGNGWLKANSAGSGAFVIAKYQPHEVLVLAANPTAAVAPKLATVILQNVPDAGARRLQIEQGDADIARGLGADQVDAIKQAGKLTVEAVPSARSDYLLINAKANETLGKPAFWKAARYLIDYEGITRDLLRGQSKVHQAFLPVGFPGALTDNPYKLDVDKAKAILAEGGITTPVKVEFPVFNEQPFLSVAQSMQASFGKAGIELDIQPGVASDIYARARAGKYQITLRYWIPDYFDPHSNASAFAVNKDNSQNTVAKQAGWVIPEITAQTLAAVKEQDPAKRSALYGEIQKEIQEESPFVFLYQGADQVVLGKNVKNYVQGLNADQVYYDQVSK